MAFGAIHNMSSDADSIRLIRAKEGIPLVVELLKSEHSVGTVRAFKSSSFDRPMD